MLEPPIKTTSFGFTTSFPASLARRSADASVIEIRMSALRKKRVYRALHLPPLLALNLAVSAGGAIVFVNAVCQSSDALNALSIPTSAAL